jgi:hypothetical protein
MVCYNKKPFASAQAERWRGNKGWRGDWLQQFLADRVCFGAGLSVLKSIGSLVALGD